MGRVDMGKNNTDCSFDVFAKVGGSHWRASFLRVDALRSAFLHKAVDKVDTQRMQKKPCGGSDR